MSRQSFACLVATALAVVAVLAVTDPASAQRRRETASPRTEFREFRGGYGNPYSSGYYSPWNYSYSRGYYPAYSAYWWNRPDYRWSGPDYYSWSTPSYFNEGIEGDYYTSPYGTGFGFGGESYGALSGAGMDNHVMISVRVPPNAEVWFEDQKTSQEGSFRSFISPPLESDRNFVYHIRARWTEDGRQVQKDRRLEVHPGDRLMVNFMKPRSESGTEPEMRGGDRALERRDRTLENLERNRGENTDRTLENRSQPRNAPRTGTENRDQTPQNRPQGDTSRPPDKP